MLKSGELLTNPCQANIIYILQLSNRTESNTYCLQLFISKHHIYLEFKEGGKMQTPSKIQFGAKKVPCYLHIKSDFWKRELNTNLMYQKQIAAPA